MFGLLQHFFHPTQCYALCAVARSGAHLLTGALQASHLAGRPLQYFHTHLAQKYAARYGLDAALGISHNIFTAFSRALRPQMVFSVSALHPGMWTDWFAVFASQDNLGLATSRKGTFFMPRSPDCAAFS